MREITVRWEDEENYREWKWLSTVRLASPKPPRKTHLMSLTCADRMKVCWQRQEEGRLRFSVHWAVKGEPCHCLFGGDGRRWLGSWLDEGWGTLHKWVKMGNIISHCVFGWPWWVFHHDLPPDQYQPIIDIKEALQIKGFYRSALEIFAPALWLAQWGLPQAADSFRGWGALFLPYYPSQYPPPLQLLISFSCQPNLQCWEVVLYWQASEQILLESLGFQFFPKIPSTLRQIAL